MILTVINFSILSFLGESETLAIPESDWCREDYKELLPGHFLNGRTSQVLCPDRETGPSFSWSLEYFLVDSILLLSGIRKENSIVPKIFANVHNLFSVTSL